MHRVRSRVGQVAVEVAVVLPVFLLCMFGVISSSLHTYEIQVATTAISEGLQSASAGDEQITNPHDPCFNLKCPALAAGYPITMRLLRDGLFGTAIVQMPADQPCDSPGQIPEGTVELCIWRDRGGPVDRDGQPALVAERVVGTPTRLVPLVSNVLPWSIDTTLKTHRVVYQTQPRP